MVGVVQVFLLWTSALPTLALLCVALEAHDHEGDSEGLAVEGHHLDDRSLAFRGTTKDHRTVPETQRDLRDSQTADTSHRQWSTRIDSNNGPWAHRSSWRTLDTRPKVGDWQASGFDDERKDVGYVVYDYDDYYHDLDSILGKSDYEDVNWDLNYEYELPLYDDYSTTLLRSQPNKVTSLRNNADSLVQLPQSWYNPRPGRPRPWESATKNFARSPEKTLSAHRSASSSWVLPQSQLITSAPAIPTRISSIPRVRDANFDSKFPIYTAANGAHAPPFKFSVQLNDNSRSKKKKKKLSSNPLIRMREFLLGGGEEENAQEKKDIDVEQLTNRFHRSVARERILKNENTRFDSGGKANILLLLNNEGEDSIPSKSFVSTSPQVGQDMDKKFSTNPIDFDKTEQGEPLIVIDVEKVTQLVQEDSSVRPDAGKKSTVDKNTAPENKRKPLENIDYSVPILPPRLPHIEDYYGSVGNQDNLLFSAPATETSGNVQNLHEDTTGSVSAPLMYSDELYDYNLMDGYDNEAYLHEQTSHSTSPSPQVPFRRGSLFSQRPPYSSGLLRVHATRPKKIKIIKTEVAHSYPYKPPRHYGYPKTHSLHPSHPNSKPYPAVHNPPHQLSHDLYGHGQKLTFELPHGYQKDPYHSEHVQKHYGKGSSLIILENVYPKGKNHFPKKTGVYEYEHESLSIPPYDHNPYVKEFSHFLPKDDHEDILLEYTANKKEDIKGVALLIARANEHQRTFVPYETPAPLTSLPRRRNFDEANDPDDGGPIYFAQLEFKNRTSNISNDRLHLGNNRESSPAEDLHRFEDQISPGRRRKKIRIIAPGSFSSLEEWTEDSSTVIKSGGGSILEGSDEV